MKLRSSAIWFPVLCFASAGAVVLFATIGSGGDSRAAIAVVPPKLGPLADAPLAAQQERLLEVAFEAATLLPENPHVKNRARNQEAVVDTWLALDQPVRAHDGVLAMSTWRRGSAFAALANYASRNGAGAEAERLIDSARKEAEAVERASSEKETAQGWQRDRIHARIAEAFTALGNRDRADEYAAGTSDEERAKLAAAKAERTPEGDFDAQLVELDRLLATAAMDLVRSALEACTRLYDGFYGDAEKRARIEERFTSAWRSVPLQVRIEMTLALARTAGGHGDHEHALVLVDEARASYDAVAWAPEDYVALGAEIAAARFVAGDAVKARTELDALAARYDGERDQIVDIWRAQALRALAEAYGVLGDEPARARAYARALDEGAVNPNGRPRVDDLVATCCSMARTGFEPDAELMERVERVRAGLVAPW